MEISPIRGKHFNESFSNDHVTPSCHSFMSVECSVVVTYPLLYSTSILSLVRNPVSERLDEGGMLSWNLISKMSRMKTDLELV